MKCFVCLLSAQLRLPFSNKFLTKLFNVSQEFQSSGHHDRINGIPAVARCQQRFHAEIPMENFLNRLLRLEGLLADPQPILGTYPAIGPGSGGRDRCRWHCAYCPRAMRQRYQHRARPENHAGPLQQALGRQTISRRALMNREVRSGQIFLQMLLQKALKKMVEAIPKPLVVERDQKQFFFFYR